MKTLANITVIGRDHTGVVARITDYLFRNGANIEEIEQQVMRGQFCMTLQASWYPEQLQRGELEKGFEVLSKVLKMEIRIRYLKEHAKHRLALLVTKEPDCPEAVARAVKSGKIPAEIGLVASNHTRLKGIAQRVQAPFLQINYQDRSEAEKKLLAAFEEHEIDWIVLARFMKILSPNFVWRYKNKIINIHPSLLPAFPGASAYRQAFERGVKVIGVSAHIVTMDLDEGPIICQDCFRVKTGESLQSIIKRGQQLEAKTLVRAVDLCLRKRLDIHWGVVHNV